MSKLTPEERYHNKGEDRLVRELEERYNYDAVFKGLEYRVGELVGELDVVAIRGEYWHYYEVKGKHSKTAKYCAKKQYRRVCEAFPHLKIKGIYYPLNGHPSRLH